MPLVVYLTKRLLRMVPALIGITLLTFLLMDLAPSDRAELATGHNLESGARTSREALDALRVHWGMADPETKQPYSVWVRYWGWLTRACRLDFAGPGENRARFRERIAEALPVTLLVNGLALLLGLGIAIPLGARLGMIAGGWLDRGAAALLFIAYGVPEFLAATLLLLAFAGGWGPALLPGRGLMSIGAEQWPLWERALDMGCHLVLPVTALAIGPCVYVTRFVRDSVARAATQEFASAMRGWGLPERTVRRSALHNGLSPLVTLLGVLLPAMISGSVVVENVFSLPGLGRLAFEAAMAQEYPMVMAMTVLVAIVTLVSLVLSDVLHRVVDPRIRLR